MIDRPENFSLPLLCKSKIGCGQARGSLCSFFHVILKSYHIWVLQVSRHWGVGYILTYLWLMGFVWGSSRSNQLQCELIFLLVWPSISIMFIMWYLHLYWYCISNNVVMFPQPNPDGLRSEIPRAAWGRVFEGKGFCAEMDESGIFRPSSFLEIIFLPSEVFFCMSLVQELGFSVRSGWCSGATKTDICICHFVLGL